MEGDFMKVQGHGEQTDQLLQSRARDAFKTQGLRSRKDILRNFTSAEEREREREKNRMKMDKEREDERNSGNHFIHYTEKKKKRKKV